jgi:membrane-bound ClpP family serine protease
MEKKVHENFIKSSNLIFITFGLGLINLFMTRSELVTGTHKAIAITTMLFILGLGYLVRQGFNWIKYLLLVLTIIGLISIPVTMMNLGQRPIIGLINVVQTVLQVWAMVILFKIPKTSDQRPIETKTE